MKEITLEERVKIVYLNNLLDISLKLVHLGIKELENIKSINNQDYYFGFNDFKEIVDYVCDIRDKTWTKYVVYDYWGNEIEEVYNN